MKTNTLTRSQPREREAVSMICFPYAGGTPNIFRKWGRFLDSGCEVEVVTLPGRSSRMSEKPFTSWQELLDDVWHQLQPCLEKPHVLFGHSFGARAAYELLRYIEMRGLRTTTQLIVSGCRSPQHPQNQPMMHSLSDGEFIEAVKTMKGTPQAVLEHPEMMKLLLPTIRADMMLSEIWADFHGSKTYAPISAILGRDDTIESLESIAGWKDLTQSAFQVVEIDGGHFSIDEEPQDYVAVITNILENTHARDII